MLGFCHLLIGLHFHYLLKRKPQCFSEMIKQLNRDVIEYMHIYIYIYRQNRFTKKGTYLLARLAQDKRWQPGLHETLSRKKGK